MKKRSITLIKALQRRRVAFAAATGCLLVVSAVSFLVLKTALPVSVQYEQANVKIDQPLSVTLTQYLQTIDTQSMRITPEVAGTWELIRGGIGGTDQLVFTPKTYFREHTTYTVSAPTAKRVYGTKVTMPTIKFTTEHAPSLMTTGMAAWKDNQVIAADAALGVSLSSPNRKLRSLELRVEPQMELAMATRNDKDFTWKPIGLLPHGSTVNFEVYDTKNQQSLLKKTVRVAAEPSMNSPIRQENLDQNTAVVLKFAQAIDPSSAKIAFDLPGKGAWKDEATYEFTPEKVAPATTYHYTIAKGLRSKEGGILQNDIVGEVVTIGPIAVVATSPRGRELAQGSQVISFTFSRPVDHASAEQRLSISSGSLAGKSWNGNTLSATVTNLGFQQTFSATIAAGVANTTFGTPSTRPYSLSFTTEVRAVKLNVPQFRQQYAATCTAASLRMILAYRGISADEMSIVQQMGYAPRARDNSTDPATWDDPQQMFVGDINGSIVAGTGAGPDAPPVAKAARAYGRSASAVTGIGSGWIAQQLYNGNPVVMFGAWKATGTTTWQTPSGRTATMNLTGHATVVIGVKGEPSAPLGFWVSDPLSGTSYWSAGAVEANIARDPYRQAVVVY